MDNAGIVFKKRSSRQPKNQNRQAPDEKYGEVKPSPSFALANERFDLAMASLATNNALEANSKPFKNDQWLSDQNIWGSMATVSPAIPNSDQANISAPSTGMRQPIMSMNQPSSIPTSMQPPPLPESEMWGANITFTNTNDPILAVHHTGDESGLNNAMSSSAAASMDGIENQNFGDLGAARGATTFESTSQMNPDLSLLTKPMTLGSDAGTSNTDHLSVSYNSGGLREKHIENVRDSITDPKTMIKLAELSTRPLLDYQTARGLKPSSVPTLNNPTSVLLTSPSSDKANEQDVCCIRVLNSLGDLDYRTQFKYALSLPDLYKKSISITELPGTAQLDTNQVGATVPFELFPRRQNWQDSDFEMLENQSQVLLKKMPTLTLIRVALKDLMFSLPFLQWDEIETYVSVFTLSSVTVRWSPVQMRQRQSLLLLLCALGSSMVPAINVTTQMAETMQAALPWELGLKCFRLARGLLCPKEGQLQEEEQTLEFIQCMILMNIFMVRCQDKQSAWSPLAHGGSVASHLLSNAPSPSVATADMSHFFVEREMLKRCVWMLFMLEIITRVEKTAVRNQFLWTGFPFKLEQPISLAGLSSPCGSADACVTQETLARFTSLTELSQIMMSILLLRLHQSMPHTEKVKEVIRKLRFELSKWASHTPCLLPTGATSSTTPLLEQSWQLPSVIPFSALYEACSFYLASANA